MGSEVSLEYINMPFIYPVLEQVFINHFWIISTKSYKFPVQSLCTPIVNTASNRLSIPKGIEFQFAINIFKSNL